MRAGADDPVRIAVVGAGGRGTDHLNEIATIPSAVQVVSVCDVWSIARDKASAAVQKVSGKSPALSSRYQDVLADKNVEAVIITTPDFTHARILKEAVEAGKDVYCEKPMATDFAEAKAAYTAVKNSKQVVQIGTQRRSDPGMIAVAKLIRAGILGQVTRIDIAMNFQEPRWRRDYSAVDAGQIDWDAFAFGRNVPRDLKIWRQWQLLRRRPTASRGCG